MNNKNVIKEIKKGNNPIILKDVVDGTTYYHTIMYVGLLDNQITTTVWATDGNLPEHLQDSRAKTLKSLTDKAFDNFRKYNTQSIMVNNVNIAYKVLDGILKHIHNTGGMDSYTTKVSYN
jgi:hypothetical protein